MGSNLHDYAGTLVKSVSAAELAEIAEAVLEGNGQIAVARAAPTAEARANEVALALTASEMLSSNAGVLVVPEDVEPAMAVGALLRTHSPLRAFNLILGHFGWSPVEQFDAHDKSTMLVHANVGADVEIGPNTVVGHGAVIGARTRIGANSTIGPDAVIGADCQFGNSVTISTRSVIGAHVVLHPGAVVGSDGSAFMMEAGQLETQPRFGFARLDEHVHVGPNAVIERGLVSTTHIGAGTKISTLVTIGHGCCIGKNCTIGAQSGLASDCELGDWVHVGPQTGVAHGATIHTGAFVGPGSLVHGSIESGQRVIGRPALSWRRGLRSMAVLDQLPDFGRRLRLLERLQSNKKD